MPDVKIKQEHIPLVTALCGFAIGIALSAFWAVDMARNVILFLVNVTICLGIMYAVHGDAENHFGKTWKDVGVSLWLLFVALVLSVAIVGVYIGCFHPEVSLAMLLGY